MRKIYLVVILLRSTLSTRDGELVRRLCARDSGMEAGGAGGRWRRAGGFAFAQRGSMDRRAAVGCRHSVPGLQLGVPANPGIQRVVAATQGPRIQAIHEHGEVLDPPRPTPGTKLRARAMRPGSFDYTRAQGMPRSESTGWHLR